MREEVAAGNPCLKISKKVREKIPARNKRDRFMSLEEEDKLFNLGLVGSRAHFRPIVRLGVHLGARLGELMARKGRHQPQYEAFLCEVEEQRTGCEG